MSMTKRYLEDRIYALADEYGLDHEKAEELFIVFDGDMERYEKCCKRFPEVIDRDKKLFFEAIDAYYGLKMFADTIRSTNDRMEKFKKLCEAKESSCK